MAVGAPGTTPAPTPQPTPAVEVRDWGRLIDQNAWKSDLAGVAAELYRLHAQPEKAKELEEQMANWDRDIVGVLYDVVNRNEPSAGPDYSTQPCR